MTPFLPPVMRRMSSSQNRISTGLATDEGSPVPFALLHGLAGLALDASVGVLVEVASVCSGNGAIGFSGGTGLVSGAEVGCLGATFDVGVEVEFEEDVEVGCGSMAVENVRMVSTDERTVESEMDGAVVRVEEPPFAFGAVDPLAFAEPLLGAVDPLTFALPV